MTNSTKELFNAPWKVRVCEKGNPEFESVFVAEKTGWLVGRDMEYETAKRVVRLPELYDALMEAVYDACQDCLIERSYVSEEEYDLIENGCVYPERDCCPKCRSWIALLKKVRDAK